MLGWCNRHSNHGLGVSCRYSSATYEFHANLRFNNGESFLLGIATHSVPQTGWDQHAGHRNGVVSFVMTIYIYYIYIYIYMS
jgi:hypothetical protein